MTFRQRNAYYLRVSTNVVLPLFLYLDERHIDWMSDVVLQHVLADLRPLVIPKLQAEKDVHFGSGAGHSSRRGTVEVHRGGTYQFAYFFRKIEPHTVLFKSRYFVTAPLRTAVVTKPTSRPADQSSSQSFPASTKRSKRTRAKITRESKASDDDLGEGEWATVESETEEVDGADPMPRDRPVRKQRRIICQEENADEVDYVHQDITMDSLPPYMDGGRPGDPLQTGPYIMQDIATESDLSRDGADVAWDTTDRPNLVPDGKDVELVMEEEERKPKPLLKLKYQSFRIPGHCLCVVVEPWPPLRVETRPQSVGLRRSLQSASFAPTKSGTAAVGERAKTPLFLPENDRAPSEAHLAEEKTLPPVPLFQTAVPRNEDDDHNDDDLMDFSQALNSAGYMHAITADDDDDMDGAVLFGDADEVRELL